MNMMNPMQMLKTMGNPRQFIQNMMGNSQIMSNPMAKNIMGMAQKGDFAGCDSDAKCRNPYPDVAGDIRGQD